MRHGPREPILRSISVILIYARSLTRLQLPTERTRKARSSLISSSENPSIFACRMNSSRLTALSEKTQ